MKQISSELKQLKQEVLARKQKRMTIKMRSFLTRLGHKRRSEALIREITYWLNKYELEAYTSKKVPWHQVKMEQWLTFSEKRVNQSAREVLVKDQAEPLRLYVHQEQALRAINKQMHERFSGILSIPTGGGKTIVAVQWLLSHGIRNKRKVLWLAHRHDLLEQAYYSIETLAVKSLLSKRKSFTCRLISGHSEHDSITEVTAMDDVVIATCMSLANAIQLFTEQWLREDEELLVIVDEAHHATAKTYQVVLSELKRYANPKILGLTATPFRTNEEEKGLLKKSFRDDLIYKIDLRTLIARGILADPYFKEVKLNAGEPIYLTDLEKEQINHFDQLPERIASQLIDHKKRNDVIVKEYVSNKEAYGKTIVFAINRKHAVLLTVLFRAKGVRAAYVISQEKESNQHRDATLHQFKTNKLDVIINVNMLTEGTDLPDVQTVLLTRPTTSRILMTQMVGRALRGTEAGGTEKASIVYFQDNWHDTLTWVLPQTLYVDESASQPTSRIREKEIVQSRTIPLEHYEQLFKQIPTSEQIDHLPYNKTIPVGVYSFTKLKNPDGETIDILVYEVLEKEYQLFVEALPKLKPSQNIWEVEKDYFPGLTNQFGYQREDVETIILFYNETKQKPIFRYFKDRHKVDLAVIAQKIHEEKLVGQAKKAYIDACWSEELSFLPIYFGWNKLLFRKRLEVELLKLEEPELFMNEQTPS